MAGLSVIRRAAHGILRRIQPHLPDRYLLVPTRSGWLRLNFRRDPGAVRRVLRTFEPSKYERIRELLPPGGTFVDVGANVGEFTVFGGRVSGPDGRVLAVEVEPTNARWLRENVRRHGLSHRVDVAEVAAADHDGETELILSSSASIHTIVESELHEQIDDLKPVGRITVPTRRLDGLLAEHGFRQPDVVKIDVEGAELMVLRGAPQLLSGDAPLVLLIDLHFGVDLVELGDLLRDAGFRLALEASPEQPIERIPDGATAIVAVR